MGIGSKFANGDLIYHAFIGVAKHSCKSIIIFILLLSFSMLCSWLLDNGYINLFSDTDINPHMPFLHLLSANICIVLSIILLIVSFCWIRSNADKKREVAKKMIGSFATGVLLCIGFNICGLSRRTNIFSSLSPGPNWSPNLYIFMASTIVLNLITYQVIIRYSIYYLANFSPFKKWKPVLCSNLKRMKKCSN